MLDDQNSWLWGQGIKEADNGLGYDHNYVLRGSMAYDPSDLQPVAKAWDGNMLKAGWS